MTPITLLIATILYVLLLLFIAQITARRANNQTYFIGNRKSPWLAVSYGMIGSSLSGVTFMSVPGWVGTTGFSYLWMVFGYFIGYFIIAYILLPIYYRYKVVSIYEYLNKRFNPTTQKTAAFFFILSRSLGSALRMFIAVYVLYTFIFQPWHIPFSFSAIFFMLIIWLYSYRGGIKTIVWTDTLQTTFMLLSLVIVLIILIQSLGSHLMEWWKQVLSSPYAYMTVTDPHAKNHWLKYLISGAFITLSMTGLDQDMMQKNLSCRTLKESQRNMILLPFFLLFFNILFLLLGASLYLFSEKNNIHVAHPDLLFATVSLQYMPWIVGIVFYIGLIAAAFSSADGTITALTTSVLIDILNKKADNSKQVKRLRLFYHAFFSLFFLLVMIIVKALNNQNIIQTVFTVASYTYGPLLGIFFFGLSTQKKVKPTYILISMFLPPLLFLAYQLWGHVIGCTYKLGFELLPLNGMLTYLLLNLFSEKNYKFSLK